MPTLTRFWGLWLAAMLAVVLVSGTAIAQQTPSSPSSIDACATPYFFTHQAATPDGCAADEATTTTAVLQRFEYGLMLWLEATGQVYVLHHSSDGARLEIFEDRYVEGRPEIDPAFPEAAAPQSFQPRRGFGEVWRTQDDVRARLGWAVQRWETVYDAQVQQDAAGTLFVQGPRGTDLLVLAEDSWALYTE